MAKKMDISKTQFDMLCFLSVKGGRDWHVRQLAKEMGISHGAASVGLLRLKELGLLSAEKRGRLVIYRLLADKEMVRHFKVFLTLLELEPVVAALRPLSERVVLFGSASEGSEDPSSDIDLLVVSADKGSARKALSDFRTVKEMPLKAMVLSPAELVRLSRTDKAFHDRAVKGITLWRRQDD